MIPVCERLDRAQYRLTLAQERDRQAGHRQEGDPRLQRGRRDRGWSVAEFFVEAGVSGSVPLADRPEGQRLLAALQRGDVVITAKLDRAFRSAADALGTLEQLKGR